MPDPGESSLAVLLALLLAAYRAKEAFALALVVLRPALVVNAEVRLRRKVDSARKGISQNITGGKMRRQIDTGDEKSQLISSPPMF